MTAIALKFAIADGRFSVLGFVAEGSGSAGVDASGRRG